MSIGYRASLWARGRCTLKDPCEGGDLSGETDQGATESGSVLCQTGEAGSTLHFLLKDGQACSDGAGLTLGAWSCAATTDTATQSCSGNPVGHECIWSVQLPAVCDAPPPPPGPGGLEGFCTYTMGTLLRRRRLDAADAVSMLRIERRRLDAADLGGWGAPPKGNNPAAYLIASWDDFFGVGGSFSIGGGGGIKVFASAADVQDYLPQGGTPATLPTDRRRCAAKDPPTSLRCQKPKPGNPLSNLFLAMVLDDVKTAETHAWPNDWPDTGPTLADASCRDYFGSGRKRAGSSW